MSLAIVGVYRLLDPESGRTIAEFPGALFRTSGGALHAAAVQARRHAAAGMSVLLTGEGVHRLYVPAPPPLPELADSVRPAGGRTRGAAAAQLELPLDLPTTIVPASRRRRRR